MNRRQLLQSAAALAAVSWPRIAHASPRNLSSGQWFDVLEPLSPDGISVAGWMRRQILEDATRGWVKKANDMSHRGIMQWDANSHLIVSYFLPFQNAYYSSSETWNSSVPYYQRLVDKTGSYGGGEFEGHWMDMLCRMAWIGGVEEYRKLAHQAVRDLLNSRDETGYLGANPVHLRFTAFRSQNGLLSHGNEDGVGSIWTALLSYYRFTGDEAALSAVTKSVDLYLDRIKGIETGFPVLNASPIAKLYLYTRNKQHLAAARSMVDVGLRSLPDGGFFLETEFGLKGFHSATAAMLLLAMTDLYRATGEQEILKRASLLNEQVVKHALQAHGAPTGHQESLADSGPKVNTEGCDIVWWSWFWMDMLRLTGDGRYGDLVEKALFNALPGQRAKDGTAWAYFTRPNQLFATRGGTCGTVYAARILVECCLGNLGRAWPIMAEQMVLRTHEGDLAIALYGSGTFRSTSAKTGDVELVQATDYPFSDQVTITVKARQNASFGLRLRIPAWCASPALRINGASAPVEVRDGWAELRRTWGPADVVELTLPPQITVSTDKDGQVLVQRGPLLYALPVQGTHRLTDEWGSFEELVTPESRWNYALVVDRKNPTSSMTFESMPPVSGGNVWEHPPCGIRVDAVRLADWKFDREISDMVPKFAHDIPEPPVPPRPWKTATAEKILLVPYGFTLLRMTHMPVVWAG